MHVRNARDFKEGIHLMEEMQLMEEIHLMTGMHVIPMKKYT